MTDDKISISMAYRWRFLRGWVLPINRDYENERLKQIAIREDQLFTELEELDTEIKAMYHKWEEEMLEQERAKDRWKANFDRFN